MEIYVYSLELELLGVLDEFSSVIWRPSYSEIGDFELSIPATKKTTSLLQKNRLLVRSCDRCADNDGTTVLKKVMIIKGLKLSTDVDAGDFLTVTGFELKKILHQRIVWQQSTFTGTAEEAIRQLLNENAIAPADEKRILPGFVLSEALGLTDSIEKQLDGSFLDEAIADICGTFQYGWEVFVREGQFVFRLYSGVDRSHGQSERPFVAFSSDFNNLYSTEYAFSAENFANTALVCGEGEGTARANIQVNGEASGFERHEVFVNAGSVSRNAGDEEKEISQSEYLKLLAGEGQKKLAELQYTEGFSGEMVSGISFSYGKDFDLGDTVTVMSDYGISRNVQVTSVIESLDANGAKLIPQFNL